MSVREVDLEITHKENFIWNLQIEEDTGLEEVIEFYKLTHSVEFTSDAFRCYSMQKKQNLKLDDNFKYVEGKDKLIISAEKEFMIELDFGDVIENKMVSLSQFHTTKDLKEHLQKYLNKESKLEQINIEIYKDGILQTDETITIYKLLDLDNEIKQPKIKAKSITQNQEPNNKKNPNKQQIGQMQTHSQILIELELLKELINSKFKILELQVMKILQDQKQNIVKELELYERDISQNQQLLEESSNIEQILIGFIKNRYHLEIIKRFAWNMYNKYLQDQKIFNLIFQRNKNKLIKNNKPALIKQNKQ